MSGKRSKNALRAYIAEEEFAEDASAVDPRATELQAFGADDSIAIAAIREAFAGTNLFDDPTKVNRILRIRSEVQKEWQDARDSFLAIGRALLSLEDVLTRAEFVHLRQSTERLFPFSDATATQLRQIARAVDSGRLPQEHCPGSYGTAYQITLLSETQLQIARERGLIRPDVTRHEIIKLRREVSVINHEPKLLAQVNHAALRDERKRLAERKQRLAEAMAAIERRLMQIDSVLSDIVDEPRKGAKPQPNEDREGNRALKKQRPKPG